MADIRPANWPALPQGAQAPARADPRSAAQRAFFQAALTGTAAPEAAAQAPARAVPAPRGPDLTIRLPDEPPVKILRPGSIIDIRV